MRYAWREFWEVIAPVIVFIVALFAAVIGGFVGIDYLGCRGFGEATGRNVQYAFGCYVEINGQYVPREYVYGAAHELRHK